MTNCRMENRAVISNFNNYKAGINDGPTIDPVNPTRDTFALALTAAKRRAADLELASSGFFEAGVRAHLIRMLST